MLYFTSSARQNMSCLRCTEVLPHLAVEKSEGVPILYTRNGNNDDHLALQGEKHSSRGQETGAGKMLLGRGTVL